MGLGRHGLSLTSLKESLWGGKVNQHGGDMGTDPKGKLSLDSKASGGYRGDTGKGRSGVGGTAWLDVQKQAHLCPMGRRAAVGQEGGVGSREPSHHQGPPWPRRGVCQAGPFREGPHTRVLLN